MRAPGSLLSRESATPTRFRDVEDSSWQDFNAVFVAAQLKRRSPNLPQRESPLRKWGMFRLPVPPPFPSIAEEVFGFVKRNLSGAERRNNSASGEKGAGKGAAALVSAQPTEVRSAGAPVTSALVPSIRLV